MAPEQARGEPVDHRADLFSLGSVLYAMCTGRPPFRAGTTLAVLRRVCEDTPRPIREVNPDIPDWLAAIVARLHAKDPADRFQSATEVADVLGRHLAELQGAPPSRPLVDPMEIPAAKVTPGRSVPGRRPLAWAAGLLLAALGGLGLAEASGAARVSEFLATVLRIPTRDGTLVVEVDDPGVGVEVDGETVAIRAPGHGWSGWVPGRTASGRSATASRSSTGPSRSAGAAVPSSRRSWRRAAPGRCAAGLADRSLRPAPGEAPGTGDTVPRARGADRGPQHRGAPGAGQIGGLLARRPPRPLGQRLPERRPVDAAVGPRVGPRAADASRPTRARC